MPDDHNLSLYYTGPVSPAGIEANELIRVLTAFTRITTKASRTFYGSGIRPSIRIERVQSGSIDLQWIYEVAAGAQSVFPAFPGLILGVKDVASLIKTWLDLLKFLKGKPPQKVQNVAKVARFANISPSHFHYISAGSGLRGVPFNFVGTRSYGRVELYIDRGDRDENKAIFDELYQQRAAIETSFGSSLTWERLNNKRASRIKSEMPGDVFDDAQRAEMIEFMVDAMSKLETSFKEPLAAIQRKFRARSSEE